MISSKLNLIKRKKCVWTWPRSACLINYSMHTISSARSLFPPKQTKISFKKKQLPTFLYLFFTATKLKQFRWAFHRQKKFRSCYFIFEIKYHIMETSCQFGKVTKLFFTSCISWSKGRKWRIFYANKDFLDITSPKNWSAVKMILGSLVLLACPKAANYFKRKRIFNINS